MSGWILAHGRSNERTLDEVVLQGATTLALLDADADFSPGDLLFISEGDGRELEWLGKVTAADSAGLDFTRPLRSSKNTGAQLWRATSALALGGSLREPLSRQIEPGFTLERSLGGEYYATQVTEPREQMQFVLEGLTPGEAATAIDWLRTELLWGLYAFTLIAPDATLRSVRLEDKTFGIERLGGGRRRLALPLTILSEGGYA